MKSNFEFLLPIMFFIVLIIVGSILFVNLLLTERIEYLEEMVDYYEEEANYYFNGANKRDLLDFCEEGDEISIKFKGDCKGIK